MNKDFEIIFKECGNKKDAEKHFKDGYTIYEDNEEGFEEFRTFMAKKEKKKRQHMPINFIICGVNQSLKI